MTMSSTLSCPRRSVSSCYDFNGKHKISIRRKYAINSSVVTLIPRSSRVPQRTFCYNSPSSVKSTGWARWIGGQEALINFSFQGHPPVLKQKARLGTRWSRETTRNDMFTKPNYYCSHDSWLGKFLKRDKSQGEGDNSQKAAVVDVRVRFTLSEPKSLADAASRLAPRWFKLLKGVQPLLPLLQQSGGGGNRDGDSHTRLGYGGDDDHDSDNSKPNRSRDNKALLSLYQQWALAITLTSLFLWTIRAYRRIPIQVPVPQFIDSLLSLALLWSLAGFCLWTLRILVSLTPSCQGWGPNAFSSGREFLLTSRVDEWMGKNVAVVPGLVVSLFVACDVIHCGKNLGLLVSRVGDELSRVLQVLNARRIIRGVPRGGGSLFSRGVSADKWRRGTSAKRRRP